MSRGVAGYGRYDDDPQHVGCPRAKSDMTPCIARGGHLALTSGIRQVCVGCDREPKSLIIELARAMTLTGNALLLVPVTPPETVADRLAELVREVTSGG